MLSFQSVRYSPRTGIREVALTYLEEIGRVKKTGPYYLAGLSIGGQIAFEMGSILAEQGFDVVVFMLDTYSGKYIRKSAIQDSAKTTLNTVYPKVHFVLYLAVYCESI